jgi:hypothetical protein
MYDFIMVRIITHESRGIRVVIIIIIGLLEFISLQGRKQYWFIHSSMMNAVMTFPA